MVEHPSYDVSEVEEVDPASRAMSADLVAALVCLPFVDVY